ncbi:gamma-glutamyltransferase [Woeseia oceani]|uniref:Glutathione hydrolase proenzyme n=1 Tax=Woeseia oceani TaxID=1548547 RepID=A0A193LL65_9GAMM|nr:gamma-glutamyltransferase [Woeseia oceani]ANO53315.1 gamma-glutamyltransferase [Woeseia oceani]
MQFSELRNLLATAAAVVLIAHASIVDAAGRAPARGMNGIVASSSAHASEVGVQVLRDGGNAVDAAIATAFAMAVTWPTAGNIGGGGFLVYHGADGTTTTFDFREKAPLAASEDMYLDENGEIQDNINHDSILAVGVPGTVAGLELAHQRLGTKPWRDLVAPAVKLAREGIPISWQLHDSFKGRKSRWDRYPSSAKVFLKRDGSFYQPGDIWKQPDLAKTLKRIEREGADGFYKGRTATLIADHMAANGGLITLEDLAKYEAVERAPITGNYRGYEIVSMPPPSSGGVTMVEMLNILEGFDLAGMGHNSAQYLHILTEAMRRAYADRANYLGDPDFNEDMPIERLTSKEHAADLRGSISLTSASASDPALFAQAYESNETTHFSVVDKDGNMVSLTYTLEWGYGSHIVVEGAGFLLNNEMGDFNAQPGITDERGRIGTAANRIRPEKRMLSSMTPTIVAKDGVPLFATGSPGGKTIINTSMQTVLNVIDHGMNIAEAIEAPRIHHQWLPDMTVFERSGISPDTRKLYESFGHTIREVRGIGSAMGVYRDPETGILYGGADSRAEDGGAVAY